MAEFLAGVLGHILQPLVEHLSLEMIRSVLGKWAERIVTLMLSTPAGRIAIAVAVAALIGFVIFVFRKELKIYREEIKSAFSFSWKDLRTAFVPVVVSLWKDNWTALVPPVVSLVAMFLVIGLAITFALLGLRFDTFSQDTGFVIAGIGFLLGYMTVLAIRWGFSSSPRWRRYAERGK